VKKSLDVSALLDASAICTALFVDLLTHDRCRTYRGLSLALYQILRQCAVVVATPLAIHSLFAGTPIETGEDLFEEDANKTQDFTKLMRTYI
jgi:hypothetical protein